MPVHFLAFLSLSIICSFTTEHVNIFKKSPASTYIIFGGTTCSLQADKAWTLTLASALVSLLGVSRYKFRFASLLAFAEGIQYTNTEQ